MKIAIQTRTYTKDYKWYSADSSFKSIAEQQWLNWHNEVYDGVWFGLITQDGQTFFLAGKIPTPRQDLKSRPIVNYIVMQSETDNDSKQLALLTADLLTFRQDISDISNPFVKWADDICAPMAEKEEYDYSPFPIIETTSVTVSETPIGRYEYPLTSKSDRLNIAGAVSAIVEKREDFLVGCIQYPVERFLGKVCKGMSPNAQIAVFSPKTTSKKELMGTQDPFSKKKSMSNQNRLNQRDRTTSSNSLKTLFNPLTIGLAVFVILVATFCHLGHQNSKKGKQIQNLTNQVSNLETTLEKLSNEIKEKNYEIQKRSEDYNNLQENFKTTLATKNLEIQQTIQRFETDIKAKDTEIEELKKQINSSKELPPPPQTPVQKSDSPVE